MQLDRTHVVVRPRTMSELCDLSLLVLRKYFLPLCVAFAAGAIPFAIINAALIGWLPLDTEFEGITDDETSGLRVQYVFWMASLIFLQTPIAGVFATHYIGQAVFEARPPWRQVLREVMSVSQRWFWTLGVVRGPVIAIAMFLWVWSFDDFGGIATFFLVIILMCVGCIRAFRPHTPEILLLERCPIRSGPTGMLSLSRRSNLLHAPMSGDSISRFLIMSILSVGLTISLFFFMIFLQGVFAQRWSFNLVAQLVYLPLAMWIVAGFSVIVRFLCYLDNRIRLEGWDVELGLRAEAIRQFGPNASKFASASERRT